VSRFLNYFCFENLISTFQLEADASYNFCIIDIDLVNKFLLTSCNMFQNLAVFLNGYSEAAWQLQSAFM
jgi:hypothetical protein